MNDVEQHLQRYPHARRSTLIYLQRREGMTQRLMSEIKPRQSETYTPVIKRIYRWLTHGISSG